MRSEGVSPHTNAIRTASAEILGMENVMMRRINTKILAAAVVLFFSASQVIALIEFNDGGEWNIDYVISDDVWIDFDSPGMGTTVNMLEGGSIVETYSLNCYENSIINMSGGYMGGTGSFFAGGSSQVTISGGTISKLFLAGVSSQVTVSGGWIGGELIAISNGILTIDGSDFTVDGTPVGYIELTSILGGSSYDDRIDD